MTDVLWGYLSHEVWLLIVQYGEFAAPTRTSRCWVGLFISADCVCATAFFRTTQKDGQVSMREQRIVIISPCGYMSGAVESALECGRGRYLSLIHISEPTRHRP
jgi:hypothetical protein